MHGDLGIQFTCVDKILGKFLSWGHPLNLRYVSLNLHIRRGFSLHFPLCIINRPYCQHYTLGSHNFCCFNGLTLLVLLSRYLLTTLAFASIAYHIATMLDRQPPTCFHFQHPWLRTVVIIGHHFPCFVAVHYFSHVPCAWNFIAYHLFSPSELIFTPLSCSITNHDEGTSWSHFNLFSNSLNMKRLSSELVFFHTH